MLDVDSCLKAVIALEASDLHLKVPAQPTIRLHGKLQPLEGTEPLMPEDTEKILFHMLQDEAKLAEFRAENEVDFAYSVPGLARFRVNAFLQRGSASLVCRAIPAEIKTIEELLLPPVIAELAKEERGIILLTGTTGSGKSTTLAAIIDQINSTMAKHIVTIEDPVEYLHRDKTSIINQREVGDDTASFGRALKRVLRQDPDVILIGEIRDPETMETALAAAETGHLVLSTLHTLNASETISRIISLFPPHMQQQARFMLAGTLKGVIAQRLVPSVDGDSRIPIVETLVSTGRVRDLILEPSRTEDLNRVIAEGEFYGMQTFDQSLIQRVNQGLISMDEALRVANNPSDMKLQAQTAVPQVPGT